MKDVASDVPFMKLALRLAEKGRGITSPNPMVGAVVIDKQGRLVGKGYHPRPGAPHAEIFALTQAGSMARGGILYVTLEPCCHTGKRTPPCVPSILESGVRRVVVAMKDPNPSVSGRGIQALRRKGIAVEEGCLRQDAERLNEIYAYWARTGYPFVILKAAMTLDGKIATARGESKWITGEPARAHLHHLRSQVDAIMVGIGTVLKDDPQLTARLSKSKVKEKSRNLRQPIRVVLDSRLRLPLQAKILRWVIENPTVVVTTSLAPDVKIERLRKLGARVLVCAQQQQGVSLRACLAHLGKMGITSLLIEGGSDIHASALRSGLVRKVMLYMAPMLLGGTNSLGVIGGVAPKRLNEAVRLQDVNIRKLGEDWLVVGYPASRSSDRSPGR